MATQLNVETIPNLSIEAGKLVSDITSSLNVNALGQTHSVNEWVEMFAHEIYPKANEIFYTTTDGLAIDPTINSTAVATFGANIISNVMERGRGIITFDGPVTRIGSASAEDAFKQKNTLTNITLPENGSFSTFGIASIAETKIQKFVVPKTATSLGRYLMNQCQQLRILIIPDTIATILDNLCKNCSKLTTVEIGSGVTSIQSNAFYSCTTLTSFTCKAATPPSLDSGAFNGVPANMNIYVPSASVNAYKAATNWSSRASYIQAIP